MKVAATTLIGGALLAVATLAAVAFKSEPEVEPSAAAPKSEAQAAPVAATAPVAPSAAASSEPPHGLNLPRLYASPNEGRAFVVEAWKHPEQGGRYYASKLVAACASLAKFSDTLSKAQPDIGEIGQDNYQKSLGALDSLKLRCGQLTEDDYKTYTVDNAGSDTLIDAINAFNGARTSGSAEARRDALRGLIALGDPLSLDEVGLSLSIYRDPEGIYVYFDGKKSYVRQDPEIAAAYYLLPCGLGLGCDKTSDVTLAIACASGAYCFESRFDRVSKEFAAGDPAKNQEVLALYQSLLSAVKTRDIAKFMQ